MGTARYDGTALAPLTSVAGWDELLVGDELAHLATEPAREARTSPLPDSLQPAVREALARRGIHELYAHQAAAYTAALGGGHLIVTTGTASGKTLAFNLPVLDALAADRHARALYLYPTKALAQDQARSLAELGVAAVRSAIYDGDTPTERRRQIRGWANLVLTNPDMLHIGVLPRHDLWGDFLHNLQFVVVDEAHVYRGVFGSHVANVLRRLRRLARIYGAEPQFLLASATIANAGELAHALTGEEATVVEDDAAPRAERTFALWNPPLLDAELGLRASALGEASRLLAGLVGRGLRTICFAKSRKSAELIHRFASDRLDAATAARLAPYRAGYTPQQRREIERRLVEGDLLGVTSTDALELGIDIGDLDCAISVGFPGTVASLRQQWARTGAAPDRARLGLGGQGHTRRTRPPPLHLARCIPRRRRLERGRAGVGRARARLLHRARGRGLPPPRPPVPRARARPAGAARARRAVRRRLVHAGEEGDGDVDRGAAARRAAARARALLWTRLGDRAGGRVPEEGGRGRLDARHRPAGAAADHLRHRGGLVRAAPASARGPRCDAAAALVPPRCRALAHRAAAAVGDVRPLGHRRPLHEPPPRHGRADRLRLRRPRRRRRYRRPRLRPIRGLGRRHGRVARRLPLRARLPLLRPEPEVRQPQRVPRQGRRPHTVDEDVEIRLIRSS